MTRTYLSAEAARAEKGGDVGAWIRAARRWWFYQYRQLPGTIVVSREFFKLLLLKRRADDAILGSDLGGQPEDPDSLVFRRIPVTAEPDPQTRGGS